MTVAAAYARFSSDAQREESIEIQLRQVSQLAEREGITVARTYRDEAVSGWKTGRREEFDRMLDDAEAGLFDVLLVYKMDRFARNVEVAQKAKRRLFRAGVRIISVREGEIANTPDGWFMSVMGDAMAEYYSRNLSVMVRNGIDQSARQLRASGRRIFGYAVDEGDHFVPDPRTAPVVREVFERYVGGQSATEICAWLNHTGTLTPRGKTWCTQNLMQLLGQVAYIGTYKYAGHEVEGGMPAIVSRETFEEAARVREDRRKHKRRRVMESYLFTGKIFCLECGRPMCGTAGTSGTGKKYTYYGCLRKDGGCGLRVSSQKVEARVLGAVAEALSNEADVDEMVAEIVAWGRSQPTRVDEYREALATTKREAQRLVESIAKGVPAEAVAEALSERQGRISDLEKLLAGEEAKARMLPDETMVREWLMPYLEGDVDDPEWRELLASTFVQAVYANKEAVAFAFNIASDRPETISFEEIKEMTKRANHSEESVRASLVWWTRYEFVRTGENYTFFSHCPL